MNDYKAVAISRKQIRNFVRALKRKIGLENELYFPIIPFVEHILPTLIPDFQFEVVPVCEMPDKEGETFPDMLHIHIREDIYNQAVLGIGRPRLTIAHEVGHLFLHRNNRIALNTSKPPEKNRHFCLIDCFDSGGEGGIRIETHTCHPLQSRVFSYCLFRHF